MIKTKHKKTKILNSGGMHKTPRFKFLSTWNFTIALISVLVLAFYLWTAGSNGVPLVVDIGPEEYFKQVPTPCLFPDISPHHYGFYNLMADAYSAGRADLLLDPPKELLELKNPRDPEQNAPWRILDLSLHNGRYYLYFGPVPTLTLFIPFRWLGIGKISEPLAAVFYCYGLFLCSTFILLRCVKFYIPNCNRWLLIFAILGLGLSNTSPYLLRHPTVYEVAIAAGAFFSMLGLCFLLTVWQRWRPEHAGAHRDAATGNLSLPLLSAVSLCFGLAVGSRPIYIFSGIFLFFLWVGFYWKRGLFKSESFKSGFAMAIPFVISVAASAWFNYIRFGSLGDFGLEKQLNASLWDFTNSNRFCNLLPGLFLRAICPPQISDVFPFIRLHQFYPFELPKGYQLEEVSGGFLTTSPIILMFLLILPFVIKTRWRQPVYLISGALILSGVFILFIESYMLFANSMRFQFDFAPPILLGSLIGILSLSSGLIAGRRAFRTFAILVLCFGIVVHVMVSLTGFRDTLRRGNPEIYFALEDYFRPVEKLLKFLSNDGQSRILDVTTPNGFSKTPDGSEGIWLGNKGVYLRIYSATSQAVAVSWNMRPNFDLSSHIRLKIEKPDGDSELFDRNQPGYERFNFLLKPGVNRICISALPVSELSTSVPSGKVGIMSNFQINAASNP